MHAEHGIDAGAEALEAGLLDEIEPDRCEPNAVLIVAHQHALNAAQQQIGERGGVAGAVIEAACDHATDHDLAQALAAEQGGRGNHRKNVHGGALRRIGHRGQIDQPLDGEAAQPLPQMFIFPIGGFGADFGGPSRVDRRR